MWRRILKASKPLIIQLATYPGVTNNKLHGVAWRSILSNSLLDTKIFPLHLTDFISRFSDIHKLGADITWHLVLSTLVA